MSRPRRYQRLFVAAYPSADMAEMLLAQLEELDLPDCRRVPLEQVHLTLHFIGDRPVREMDHVRESVKRAASGLRAIELQPLRLLTLPEGDAPRLIVAETDAPAAIIELHRRLVTRFARAPRAEEHAYLPHLTLARFRRGSPCGRIDCPLDLPAVRIEEVCLMRSKLRPEGASHEIVEQIPI